jgi:hypothetical protein
MSIAGALRQGLTDFYFNSWRLAPANLVWGLGFVAMLLAGPLTALGVVLLVLLAIPTAGLHRMAALIARDEPVALSDFVDGMRRYAVPALVVGAGAAILATVFTTNVIVGFGAGGPLGWFLSAMALWGEVALAMLLVAFWPILADPRREDLSLRRRLGLAGLAVIGRPAHLFAFTLVVAAILLVSAVLFAALVLVSVAYVSLISARYVLPMVDTLEARLPGRRLLQGGLEPEEAAPSQEGSRRPASPS